VTQQNASLVEQAAAASEALQGHAGELAQVVSVFKLDGMQSAVLAPVAKERRLPHAKASVKPAGQKNSAKSGAAVAALRAKQLANGEEWK
jgi:methyl-accepting chemotaxis protein